MQVPIVYNDDAIIVVNKPNNLLVHHSYYARNIEENSLVQLLKESHGDHIYPVHRLDRKTSGLLIFAKSPELAAVLQNQFENQRIEKDYYALVRGFTPPCGIIDSPIKKDEMEVYQVALTHFSTIESVEIDFAVTPYSTARYSLVCLSPKTGRMHQLRKHMNKIAHPIIGDPKHGNRHHNHFFINQFNCDKLFLHAAKLTLDHPVSKQKMTFRAGFPEFWNEMLTELGFETKPKFILQLNYI